MFVVKISTLASTTTATVWRHVMFFVCWFIYMLEYVATVFVHWAELFLSMKLQNCYVD